MDARADSILVIGSANADMIMGLPRLPGRGETVTDGTFLQTFGGKGSNQAVAAKRAGAPVSFVSCLGQDDHGNAIYEHMLREGIDLTWTVRTSDAPTGAALVLFDQQGENYLAVAPGSNYHLRPDHLIPAFEHIADFALVVLQCEIPPETIQSALESARASDTPVLLNYAPASSFEPAFVCGDRVGLVVNQIEATQVAGLPVGGVDEAHRAARALMDLGFAFAVVTLGAAGCCFCSRQGRGFCPAIRVKAVDSTAAGDTFCGAMAAAMVRGSSLEQAIVFATAAASLCVQRAGAQPSIPLRADVLAVLAAQRASALPTHD